MKTVKANAIPVFWELALVGIWLAVAVLIIVAK